MCWCKWFVPVQVVAKVLQGWVGYATQIEGEANRGCCVGLSMPLLMAQHGKLCWPISTRLGVWRDWGRMGKRWDETFCSRVGILGGRWWWYGAGAGTKWYVGTQPPPLVSTEQNQIDQCYSEGGLWSPVHVNGLHTLRKHTLVCLCRSWESQDSLKQKMRKQFFLFLLRVQYSISFLTIISGFLVVADSDWTKESAF